MISLYICTEYRFRETEIKSLQLSCGHELRRKPKSLEGECMATGQGELESRGVCHSGK